MTHWNKSGIYGGIYASSLHATSYNDYRKKTSFEYQKVVFPWLENWSEKAKKIWEKSTKLFLFVKNNLKSHISQKQELYWPVLVAIILLCFIFVSKLAFAESIGVPNNLPIKNNPKLNIIGLGEKDRSKKLCFSEGKNEIKIEKAEEIAEKESGLQEDIAKIVKNTPMAVMIDLISKKDRTVAAFIVGIAMKESKFGVYSPKVGGRDCYNYWGFKGGGKTVAGGYTCFASPDDAVEAVSHRIEKMVAKGVRNPAQAISWKCGSSCAGHGAENVRKWIADVGINFYKINS